MFSGLDWWAWRGSDQACGSLSSVFQVSAQVCTGTSVCVRARELHLFTLLTSIKESKNAFCVT